MLKNTTPVVKKLLKKLTIGLFGVITLVALGSLVMIWYFDQKPRIGGDFTLNYHGSEWNLVKNAKKINVLYFGYAQCPDVCPLSLSVASQAFRQLNEAELKEVQLVFLSVDHKHDTAKQVAEYATQFFPQFIGTTGTEQQIDQTVKQFKASYVYEKNEKSYLGYSIAHTDRLYILNKKGFVIDTIPSPRDYKIILTKIKENL